MSRILQCLIGFTLFAAALCYAGPAVILDNILNIGTPMFTLLIFATFANFLFSSLATATLAKSKNNQIKWRDSITGVLATSSISLFAPGRLGDLALTFYWKDHFSYEQSLSIIILDKIITLIVLFAVVLAGFIFFPTTWPLGPSQLAFLLLAALGCVVATKLFIKIFHTRLGSAGRFITSSMKELRMVFSTSKAMIVYSTLLTIIKTIIAGLTFWASLLAVGVDAPPVYSICVLSLAQLIAFIPITIMGLGTLEAACVYGLSFVNVSSGSVVAALAVGRIIGLLWLTIFFGLFSRKMKPKLT